MSLPTQRLYYQDPWLHRFEARIVAQTRWQRAVSIILDRSAFYPESGGQMADRGHILAAGQSPQGAAEGPPGSNRLLDSGKPDSGKADSGEVYPHETPVAVIDVQVDDAGLVHHIVSGQIPAIDAPVQGVIDMARRRAHMALHTGQHILSRALLDEARAETISSRLGETGCTIDTPRANIPERELARAEALVNRVIDDDLPIRAFFPEPGELESLSLRRAPKVEDHIRVVVVGGFDASPCGGTHCTGTAQVGLVAITGAERYKGGTRIHFTAGARARNELMEHSRLLRELGRSFSSTPDGVPTAVERLRGELRDARGEIKSMHLARAEHSASQLIAQARQAGSARVIATIDGGPEALRAVAKRIAAESDLDCFLASPVEGGTHVIIACGRESSLDCGQLLKDLTARIGGRGGGRPDRAEGRLPPGIDWSAEFE